MAEIVVGVDGSGDSELALRWAVGEARLRGEHVRAVFAWMPGGPLHADSKGPPATSPEHPRWVAQQVLSDVTDRVREAFPGACIVEQAVFRPPVAALLEASRDQVMLVVGARGLGDAHRMLTGSVSIACIHGASVPVVVVHDHAAPARDGRPVVVGVDGSPGCSDALRWAADEAALLEVPLRVVHSYAPLPAAYAAHMPGNDAAMEKAAYAVLAESVRDCLADRSLVRVEERVAAGGPAACLVEASRDAQLVVVGTRGSGGFADLQLGATAGQCAQHAHCPVAVIPSGNGAHTGSGP